MLFLPILKHIASELKMKWLMLFRATIVAYYKNNMKSVNALCAPSVECS
jgi:hypothetical protein